MRWTDRWDGSGTYLPLVQTACMGNEGTHPGHSPSEYGVLSDEAIRALVQEEVEQRMATILPLHDHRSGAFAQSMAMPGCYRPPEGVPKPPILPIMCVSVTGGEYRRRHRRGAQRRDEEAMVAELRRAGLFGPDTTAVDFLGFDVAQASARQVDHM